MRMIALLAVLAALAPLPMRAQEDGGTPFTIAQLQYDGGGDWYANPSSLPNLLAAIHDRTGVPVALGPRVDIRLTDPRLRDFPYVFITGHGNIKLTDDNADGFAQMPKVGLLDAQYRGMDSAQVYNLLKLL